MKQERQNEILAIIAGEVIETQEQLQETLVARGYHATQATISRDMKELSLVKELLGGHYRYTVSNRSHNRVSTSRLVTIFKEGVLSVVVAQNIIVVKTMPGLASAACAAVDSMDFPEMVGTLAGDDTGMLIMTDLKAAIAAAEELKTFLH
ncbi:MAG: arginine repressor [Eubacteriales bacterium]